MNSELVMSKHIVSFSVKDICVLYNLETGFFIELTNNDWKNLKEQRLDNIEVGKLKELREKGFVCNSCSNPYIEKDDDSLVLSIFTTTNCNARCFYCFENGCKKMDMPISTAKGICEFIVQKQAKGKVRITWFGGEPLLNQEAISCVSNFLIENGIDFESSIITNGYLIDTISASLIDDWKVRRVQISIDRIGEEYNKIKQINDGAFERVIKNIHFLLDVGVFVKLRINFLPDNSKEALKVIDFIYAEFGKRENLKVYAAHLYGENAKSPLDFIPENNPYLRLYERLLKYGYINSPKDIGLIGKSQYCSRFDENYYVISPSGEIFKCNHEIYDDEKIGEVGSGFIKSEVKASQFPFDECETCIMWTCCRGGCVTKQKKYRKEFVCSPIKNCLKEILKMFYIKNIDSYRKQGINN